MPEQDQQDAVRFIREQHDQVRELFAAIADGTPQERKDAFEPLVRLLAVHETAEEMVVYPLLRAAGDEGVRIVESRLEEEDQAKKHLVDLERMDPTAEAFLEPFGAFRAEVEAHAEAEEREVLPLLERTTDEAQLRRMTAALKVAEGMAPTHPHKTAPESAIGNALVGPFVATVDRVRDAIKAVTS